MKTNLLIIMALLFISSGVMAQNRIWEPGADLNGVGVWSDPANWRNGLPGTAAGDRAIFRGGACSVDSDVSPAGIGMVGDYNIELGDNKNENVAKLIIENGGYVAATKSARTEIGIWRPAVLTIETGGELYFEGTEFIIASSKDAADGNAAGTEVHINGGTLTVRGNIFGIDFFNDKVNSGGTLFMNGGLLDLNTWTPGNMDDPTSTDNMSIGKNGKIAYTNGLIKIEGDHKASLEWLRDQGRIIGVFDIWVEEIAGVTFTKLSNRNVSTSVNDLKNEAKSINLYPNPATTDIIYLNNVTNADVEIYDITGQTMLSRLNTSQVNIQNLKPGIYFLRINSDGIIQTIKFLRK